MGFLKWNDELDVGVDKFNSQHRTLISKMNDLYTVVENEGSKEEVLAALWTLGEYVVKHFKEEEEYFDSVGYVGSESHKIIHKKLLETYQGHVDTFKNQNTTLGTEFFGFLKFWLTSHIKGIDTKYGDKKNLDPNLSKKSYSA